MPTPESPAPPYLPNTAGLNATSFKNVENARCFWLTLKFLSLCDFRLNLQAYSEGSVVYFNLIEIRTHSNSRGCASFKIPSIATASRKTRRLAALLPPLWGGCCARCPGAGLGSSSLGKAGLLLKSACFNGVSDCQNSSWAELRFNLWELVIWHGEELDPCCITCQQKLFCKADQPKITATNAASVFITSELRIVEGQETIKGKSWFLVTTSYSCISFQGLCYW